MDALEAIKRRRSIRGFTDEPLDKETMTQILDAARWAPSGGNQQRWRFVVVTDPTVKEMIRKVSPGIFAMPAAFIVICMKKKAGARALDEWLYAADCGIAAQNIMLAAFSLGIGTCVVASFAKEALREILEVPEGIEPSLIVTLGHYESLPEAPERKPLKEIAFLNRYGEEWEQ